MKPIKTNCLLFITSLFIIACEQEISDFGIPKVESVVVVDSLDVGVDSISELMGTVADTGSTEFQLLTDVSEQINNDSLIQAEHKLQFIRENILDIASLQNIIWARYKAAYCVL